MRSFLWMATILFWRNWNHGAESLSSPVEFASNVQPAAHSRTAFLLFQGNVTILSDPLPREVTRSQLVDFMGRRKNMVAFAVGAREEPLSDDWRSAWHKCCREWYGPECGPAPGDVILSTSTWTTFFPGLRVGTTVYTGAQLLPSDDDQHARYRFLVLGQTQRARGLAPMVWIFHQVMGIRSTTPPTSLGPLHSVLTVEERTDGWRFRLDTRFQFHIEFPAILLKILPVSRTKGEKLGSAALSKTITQEGRKGIESGCKAFLEFYHQQQTKPEKPTGLFRRSF